MSEWARDERAEMRAEMDCLKAECAKAVEKALKCERECEELRRIIDEQAKQIENYKGQVGAYQYALNCPKR